MAYFNRITRPKPVFERNCLRRIVLRVHHAFGYFGRNKKPKAKMTTTCPDCHEPFRIAPSKRLQICPNCASIERTGKSIKEIAREKSMASLERSRVKSQERQAKKPKTAYKIPARSVKGEKRERETSKAKTEMKRAAIDGSFCECEGCGNYFDVIDASHIIPVSQSSALASNPKIMSLLCRGCHTDFEHGTVPQMIKLKCFIRDMATMFEFDNSRFWNIFYRLRDEWLLRPTPKLSVVLDKLERLDQ